MPARDLRRALALADSERQAILSGRYDRLAGISAGLAAAVSRIGPADSAADAGRLGRELARNRRLLSAALEGLRDASGRPTGPAAGGAGFASYGPGGNRAPLAGARPSVEHRA